jgi:hypothetical protein
MVSPIMIILFGTGNKREETIMKSTLFALAFFALTFPAFGQGVDPLIGTWKLNVEKSTSTAPQKSNPDHQRRRAKPNSRC